MSVDKAIQMIDEYLQERELIDKEWVKVLLLCRRALILLKTKEEGVDSDKGKA